MSSQVEILAFPRGQRAFHDIDSMLAILEPHPASGAIQVRLRNGVNDSFDESDQDEAEELCEEYICAICQGLVLDAHTVSKCFRLQEK